jgi:hypothetical protein
MAALVRRREIGDPMRSGCGQNISRGAEVSMRSQ